MDECELLVAVDQRDEVVDAGLEALGRSSKRATKLARRVGRSKGGSGAAQLRGVGGGREGNANGSTGGGGGGGGAVSPAAERRELPFLALDTAGTTVTWVDSEAGVEEVHAAVVSESAEGRTFVGIDAEWKPIVKSSGSAGSTQVELLQLAVGEGRVFLLDCRALMTEHGAAVRVCELIRELFLGE